MVTVWNIGKHCRELWNKVDHPAKKVALPDGYLSPHFTQQEMTKSQTATRLGIDNTPTEKHINALKELCLHVLEPCRNKFGRSITPSSGYRSKELCKAIGSKVSSQHAKGQAVDFEIPSIANIDVARYIRDNLDFDQLILEFYKEEDPEAGWVHCSYKSSGNRKQALIYNGKSYKKWSD
jgi:zinc D-Ala-D-Ala carboxypeptidase